LTSTLGRHGFPINLLNDTYRVAYENRNMKVDRDYAVFRAIASGKGCGFDVGANVGLASLIMLSQMHSEGRLYAFEASEDACRQAHENLRLNHALDKVYIINTLVTEQAGDICEFYWDFSSGGASVIPGYLGHNFPIRKSTLSLDAFCARQAVKPEFIKIDVEGAEFQVLRGAVKVMYEAQPVIMVELHSWKDFTVTQNATNILPMIHETGYKMVYLRTKQVVEDAAVFKNRGRCHVLLLPKQQNLPDQIQSLDLSGL